MTIDTTASNDAGSNVYGYDAAIVVQHEGSGDVTITTGDVFGRHDEGIYLYADNAGANATINTTDGSVDGGTAGISVKAYNDDGDVNIITADVDGGSGPGIKSYIISGYDIDTIINTTAGKVIGGTSGIDVDHGDSGTGYISITTAGVTGKADYGIDVDAGDSISDVTIITTASNNTGGEVYGYESGIRVKHYGSGSVSITTADVTGQIRIWR